MDAEDKKYILDNIGKKTVKEIAGALGLKERKVKKFLDENKSANNPKKLPTLNDTEKHTAFSGMRIPYIAVLFVLIIAGIGVYFNSFHNDFVFDDVFQVVNNTAIRSFKNIPDIFSHSLSYYGGEKNDMFYRPLQNITYMVNYFFGKLNPAGYHAMNAMLHIAVSVLLFYFVSLISQNRVLSFLTALLYLVHPVHTEAVTYISGRADSLCTIFLLLMMIFQFKYWHTDKKYVKMIYYALILICLLLGLLSKELAMIFPLLLMFTEYCLRSKEKYEGIFSRRFFFYVPLIILTVIWFFIKNSIVATETMVTDPNALKLSVILRTVPKVIFDYIKISFFPVNLHMEYKLLFPKSVFQEGYLGPFIFILFLLPFVYFIWHKGRFSANYRILFFGIGWFLAGLLPYLNIFFNLNALFSEHWLYIPEMGLVLFVVYYLFYHSEKIKPLGWISLVFCLAAAAIFSYLTVRQNAVWKDNITFFTYTIKHSPSSVKTYSNLAVEYIKRQDFIKAEELLGKALKIEPNYPIAVKNMQYVKSKLSNKKRE